MWWGTHNDSPVKKWAGGSGVRVRRGSRDGIVENTHTHTHSLSSLGGTHLTTFQLKQDKLSIKLTCFTVHLHSPKTQKYLQINIKG